jgi:hypothetical protein
MVTYDVLAMKGIEVYQFVVFLALAVAKEIPEFLPCHMGLKGICFSGPVRLVTSLTNSES